MAASYTSFPYYGDFGPENPNRVTSLNQLNQPINQPINQSMNQSMMNMSMPMMMVPVSSINQSNNQSMVGPPSLPPTMMMSQPLNQSINQSMMSQNRAMPTLSQAMNPQSINQSINQSMNQANMGIVEPMMQSSIPYYTYGFDPLNQSMNQSINQFGSYFVPMQTYSMGIPSMGNQINQSMMASLNPPMEEDPAVNSQSISRPPSRSDQPINQSINQSMMYPYQPMNTSTYPVPLMQFGQSINQSMYQPAMYSYDPSYGFSSQSINQPINQSMNPSSYQYVTFPSSMPATMQIQSPNTTINQQPMHHMPSIDMSNQAMNQSINQSMNSSVPARKSQNSRRSLVRPSAPMGLTTQPITQPINLPSKYSSVSPLSPTSFYTNLLFLKRSTVRLQVLPCEHHAQTPLFVSSRQYTQILKRREARKNDRRTRIKAKHKSRQLHAARRVRGQGGRFLTKEERQQIKQDEQEEIQTNQNQQTVKQNGQQQSRAQAR